MTSLRGEVARALAEARIREVRRHETPAERIEEMIAKGAAQYGVKDQLAYADAAIAVVLERAAWEAESGPPFAYVMHGEFEKPGSPYDRGVADERERIAQAIRFLSKEQAHANE